MERKFLFCCIAIVLYGCSSPLKKGSEENGTAFAGDTSRTPASSKPNRSVTFSTDVVDGDGGFFIAPRPNARGEKLVIDSLRWDVNTTAKGKVRILTNKSFERSENQVAKRIVEFDDNGNVQGVARIFTDGKNGTIEYENKQRKVSCPYLHDHNRCYIYSIDNCPAILRAHQSLFENNIEKAKQCLSSIYSLSEQTTLHHSNHETMKIAPSIQREMNRYIGYFRTHDSKKYKELNALPRSTLGNPFIHNVPNSDVLLDILVKIPDTVEYCQNQGFELSQNNSPSSGNQGGSTSKGSAGRGM